MPAFCRAMSGGSASRNPTPAYDGATPRRTGIRNRFPPAASAPPGKPGKSETKSGKDCGLATDSGSASRKKQTDNHFRTPVCIVQFARIIPDSENGKQNNDFLTSAATDVNSELPHRKIQ